MDNKNYEIKLKKKAKKDLLQIIKEYGFTSPRFTNNIDSQTYQEKIDKIKLKDRTYLKLSDW